MMDYKDPEKVLEICAMATKGPWEHQHEHYGESVTSDGGSNVVCFPYAFADAQFIALSRTALPYWVERARQLEAALRGLLRLTDSDDPVEVGCHCTDTGTGAPLNCVWCKAKEALESGAE